MKSTNKNLRGIRLMLTAITALMFSVVFGAVASDGNQTAQIAITTMSVIGSVALTFGFKNSERRSMAFACGSIAADITLNCNDPLTAGVQATFYIANKADISSITYDGANPMLATAITMVATKTFFTFEGQLQSTEPSFAMVKGKFVNQFEHTVSALIFKIDPTTKKEINAMKDGDFVVIVKNNYTGTTGNCKYEIYGAGSGLKAEILERNPNDTENLGAFKITLKTQEYAREGKPPVTFFDTDLATTDAAITALL